MGDLTTSLILLTTTFLLGTLAVHWTADHLLLWQSPITRASLLSAHGYYAETLGHLSARALAALYALGGAAVLACCVKIAAGRESNWLFDGASLFLYGAVGLVYFQKIRPSILALPTAASPAADPLDPLDLTLVPLRELASSNAVIAVALIGVLILQAGQYYSERLEERERIEEDEARVRRRRRRAEKLLATQAKLAATSASQ
ncbi:hypothetical protein FA09DRAFT_328320 [Tilletiopsis washingtonensis]|uniref:Shr3 amino acid permease chaperone n=1 Tax=Tilletiopsis washingtonensis TaxID=58919 RepID=A0A316ZIR5_9BASI|nr:hypothetical protein FA09DRAFT_328320 [Tilletiopsis washingtonensis]PWO00216.1 hypothetical protein FA09DRAFT_328320 [Tilletiopsis washingtonensis]